MTFIKGHTYGKRFKAGKPPIPHREGCGCFRCTGRAWNTGISTRGIIGEKITKSLKGKIGKKSRRWLGDKAKYSAIHMYIRKYYGKANKCEHCKTLSARRYEWSNVSQTYQRDISDWQQLCTSCHKKYDNFSRR